MLARFERSWQLVKASGSVVRDNPSLLLFPLLSVMAAGMVVVSFTLPLDGSACLADVAERDHSPLILWMFLLYIGAAAGAVALGGAGFDAAALGVVLTAALGGVILFLLQNTLQAVYSAALYRHVAGATVVAGFPPDLLSRAFVTKSRR